MHPNRARVLAAEIDAAHLRRRLLDADADGRDLPDLAAAYAVQRELTALRTARGARRIGWKLGYTSAAMREQMRVDAPNLGPLLDSMLVPDGGAVPAHLVHPRAEPEIAVRIGADGEPVEVRAALEIVDSVWRDYWFTLEANTADGSSAAGVVLGPVLPADGLDVLAVQVRRNGEPAGRGSGAAAMGHPFTALRWLAGELPRRGERLCPGDLVITGGLTAAVPIEPGDEIAAVFGDGTEVRVRRP
ncbi:2-keto-4-pentenoate hydratase [Pseudonocardia bannensis]|uniref:Hydratase n=1 Tax=Pseudonocardia bannensis TaxID=630973 RepID=A0A848DCH0_9PSEU|nr:fumarylacetoacetate hydrolase family protein [Pseudonocardia bannensis]NMH90284.1 hydratase [Pseudonocardia bannensis]